MNGHELDKIFYAWSVWSQDHGEVITKENVSGFVQGVREALAAGASEGQEPVAWRVVMEGQRGERQTVILESLKDAKNVSDFGDPVPLYEHPSAEIAALRERIAGMEKEAVRYREAGVWEPDGSKFRTYRNENLNGKAMYVREEQNP